MQALQKRINTELLTPMVDISIENENALDILLADLVAGTAPEMRALELAGSALAVCVEKALSIDAVFNKAMADENMGMDYWLKISRLCDEVDGVLAEYWGLFQKYTKPMAIIAVAKEGNLYKRCYLQYAINHRFSELQGGKKPSGTPVSKTVH